METLENRCLLSTFTVSNTADSGIGSLRSAISQANAGPGAQSINFDPSVFNTQQTITLSGLFLDVFNSSTITITGPDAGVVINANNLSQVFRVESGTFATFSNLNITGGTSTTSGGGIYALGPINLTNCTISGNTAVSTGGGLYAGGPATLTNCTIAANTAQVGAAIASSSGNVLGLINCTISANTSSTAQIAGIFASNAILTNSIVAGNIGVDKFGNFSGQNNLFDTNPMLGPLGDYGGPTLTMPLLSGSPAIDAGSVSAPQTDQRGQPRVGAPDIGAFESGNPLVVNSTSDGVGSAAGQMTLRQAISLANALPSADAITFDSTTFSSAKTITLAGAQIDFTDTAGATTLTGPAAGVTIDANNASRVFKVDQGAKATISGLTISGGNADNSGGLEGGGLCVDYYGEATLIDCTISGNTAIHDGGGIYATYAHLTVTDCTISGNSSVLGAGVCADGPTTISNSTISDNIATDSGGGLWVGFDGDVKLTNCTIVNNRGSYGGGLVGLRGIVDLVNCTVVGNTADGIIGAHQVTNCIVSLNSGQNFNNPDPTDFVGGDPLLAPLGFYGGKTKTMPLLPGSPAIDSGDPSQAPIADQRGNPRVGRADIGAFESGGFQLAAASGSNQSAVELAAFPAPLVATITANNPLEPVAGGTVTFTAPFALLSGTPATIGSTGTASAPATANNIVGTLLVSASTLGAPTPAIFNLLVLPYLSNTTLNFSSSPVNFGDTVVLSAAATSAGTPTGSIAFIDGTTTLGTAAIDATGAATYSTSSLFVGTHSITAHYLGDADNAASNSTTTPLIVDKAASSLTLSFTPALPLAGVPVTLTVTATATATPTGSVTFLDGTSTLGSGAINTAGLATFSLAFSEGMHSLTAVYDGDATVAAASAPPVTLVASRNGTATTLHLSLNAIAHDATVLFAATVTPLGGSPTGTVAFESGSNTLGTATLNGSGIATFAASSLNVGFYNVVAVYAGSGPFPASGSTPQLLLVGTANQRFVNQLYVDLFGRNADPAGLAAWSGALDSGQYTQAQVATALTSSREYDGIVVDAFYFDLLGRHAESLGLNAWIDQMQKGLNAQVIRAGILGSDEYYNRTGPNHAHGDDTTFITSLYQTFLGRAPESGGLGAWLLELDHNPANRQMVASGISNSDENRTVIISGFYQSYLHRDPDPSGLAAWKAQLAEGISQPRIVSFFVTTGEYLTYNHIA